MSTTAQNYRAYGNFVPHRSPGVLGAGLLASGILFVGLMVTLITGLFLGIAGALTALAVVAVAFAATGTPVGSATGRRVTFFNTRRKGEHQWRSGVTSRNASPHMRLPGMLGRTRLLERLSPFGHPFAVVHNPAMGGTYTIIARCIAEGPHGQDQDRIDTWVGQYSQVLTLCSQEPALVCAKAITDTAPDPGGRLAAMVSQGRSATAPAMARQVIDEIVEDYPTASSENITYFELTFRGRGLDRKARQDTILTELARRVPGFMGQLAAGGAGSVSMVTAGELPAIVRCAYDPASQTFIEQSQLNGEDPIEWNEAGPVAAQECWDRYTHDSGASITWEMERGPRSAVTERALAGLLMPHPDFTRKRVALIYRPLSPDSAADVSENDVSEAVFRATQSKGRVTASSSKTISATEQTRQEVASGAALVRWYLMVTATVRDVDDLDQAASTIGGSAGVARLRLRRCFGAQAASFAATLPVGFVPWEHTAIPDKVREMI
ncbi:SCO6880 family protein [Nocardioides sp. Root140]|uniref:SCO6880 family protein n=1 Tax=Nocardioides sp. Root140 TaxID=1736460 RepID=UPI0006FAB49E|nr:SCO6880 family protein [Nocardioides sp. Root140]KQY61429.1 hypothetical protein ASD30_25555 [Nocardioides sp. Root140]